MIRDWRLRRRRSQLDLSIDVGVSTRHLSFVETGRSRPSPELVLAIAHHLEVPLRDRNSMLLAAGYAPRFGATALDAPAMTRVYTSLQRMLAAHDPYPGVVIDSRWDVVLANRAASALMGLVGPAALLPVPNVFRMCLHPDGLAPHTVNFNEWAAYLLAQLSRLRSLRHDPFLDALADEIATYPNMAVGLAEVLRTSREEPTLLVSLQLRTPGGELSMFTTLTTFGTPLDITLDELAVELFYPADDDTDRALHAAQLAALG
jgi:transcriptional regulator with XRE-family HTH domain